MRAARFACLLFVALAPVPACGRIGVELILFADGGADAACSGVCEHDSGAVTPVENVDAGCSGLCELDTGILYADGGADAGCSGLCGVDHGTVDCRNGPCVVTCEPGYDDCDGRMDNGCEIALQTDAVHCGGCGRTCTNAYGTTSCAGGTCAPVCSAGFDDCDGSPENGCETALNTANNCGACGQSCSGDADGGTSTCESQGCPVVCNNLSGVYALKVSVATSWPVSLRLAPGSGTFVYWGRLQLMQNSTQLTGEVVACGCNVPDFEMVNQIEDYGVTFPSSVWDKSLPATPVRGTLSTTEPGATLVMERSALIFGVSLPDPVESPWPGLLNVQATDHDMDGRPGITAAYKSGIGYFRPPVNNVGSRRASEGYLATRLVFSMSGTLTSCTASSGSAQANDIDTHTVGCRLFGGGECDAEETDHLDSNTPNYNVNSASYSLVKLGDVGASFSCSQVRSTLP